jgi:hypothetical protein
VRTRSVIDEVALLARVTLDDRHLRAREGRRIDPLEHVWSGDQVLLLNMDDDDR